MPVDYSLATDIHETLSRMDDAFTDKPHIPLHTVIGLWDVVRDRKGWHVDISVYETSSLSALKAWLVLRCTDLMCVGQRTLRSSPPRMNNFRVEPVGDTRKGDIRNRKKGLEWTP